MTGQIPTLLTIGEIARRLDQPIHRVEYVLRSRNVAPAGWAGNARLRDLQAWADAGCPPRETFYPPT